MSTPTPAFRRLTAIATLAVVLAACGGSDDDATTTSAAVDTTASVDLTTTSAPTADPAASPTDYAGFRAQPTACEAEPPPEPATLEFPAPEDMGIDPESRPLATLATSCGDIVIELDPSLAPETVNSFVFLAESGYYDGTAAHRILQGYVLQAGDPTATGLGSPGYTVPDEFPPADYRYVRGAVAMANAGPGTTGSQFFIMFQDAGGLPPEYTVFGMVVEGEDALDTIATVPVGPNSQGEPSTPLETVYINTVTIER